MMNKKKEVDVAEESGTCFAVFLCEKSKNGSVYSETSFTPK